MAQNFLACDRDRVLLMAPSLRDWLPEDHFAWFVLDAVARMDLSAFYAAYRQDGHGRAAFDPAMMVALLLYGEGVAESADLASEPGSFGARVRPAEFAEARRCAEDAARFALGDREAVSVELEQVVRRGEQPPFRSDG